MAITPPTDAELLESAKVRLRLLGVDVTTLPVDETVPNDTNSPTQAAVLNACVTVLRGLSTVAETKRADLPADPVFYGATTLGVEIESDAR